MKKFIFLISLSLFAYSTQAQQTILVNESFNTIPSGWSVSPSGSWIVDSTYSVSSPNSVWGFVPNTTGDSVELISPWFNFTNYAYAFLQFSHICKVVSSDICNIKYQEVGMPAWKTIPLSSYLGSNPNAYMNLQFSQGSYSTWIPGDSLAVPTNFWWKEEVFDISNEVSYAQVRFKFTIKKGNVLGTQFVYGWMIDNFKITASAYEIKPPVVEFLTIFGDTVYNTGPFTIRAKVATRTMAPIKKPVKLNVAYTYNHVITYDTLIMIPVAGDSIYSAIIPQKVFGTSISYNVYGEDTVGNNDYDYAGFVLKRTSGGSTNDSTQIGKLGAYGTDVVSPFNVSGSGMNWSRAIYLSSNIGNTSQAKLISGLAYHCDYFLSAATRYQTQCYLKATSLTNALNSCIVDPISEGATKVYQGTWTTKQGWNKFVLDRPFILPPGSNLMVYWIDSSSQNVCNNSGVESTEWDVDWVGNTYGMDWQYTNYNCDKTGCNSDEYIPVTLMYFGGVINDTNSVALYAIESPGKHVLAGQSTPIVSTIKNKGYANLDSCIIAYSINGVQQAPVYWKGNLPDDFNSTDTIGYYIPRLKDYDTIVVWVSMPNGIIDGTIYDDTLQIITYGCNNLLNGDYVIGLDTGADFTSIASFLDILNLCGSSGNITLKFQNGVYQQNWNLSNLGSLMGNNTLIITTLSGNRDSVVLGSDLFSGE